MALKYADILHPDHRRLTEHWLKWRRTYESGDQYIRHYLIHFKREAQSEFEERRRMTYVPAFAKEAVNEVKNSVHKRLNDVVRVGGSETYQRAVRGELGGVDRKGSDMATFLGKHVLPEMLPMRQVGVWVDMPEVQPGSTRASTQGKHPYFYTYPVEAIRSWRTDDEGNLTSILLRDCTWDVDAETDLPTGSETQTYRLAWLDVDGVHVIVQDEAGEPVGPESILNLPAIPFEFVEIDHSLLQDVCNHQRTLLNMESTDAYWVVKANWPLYTEQYDPRPGASAVRTAAPGPKVVNGVVTQSPGEAKDASESRDKQVTVGPQGGRGYPVGAERPAFIHPSSEPITAAMAKEEKIKEDIRRLVHLSVAMLDPRMASAESKQMDNQGLQDGLLAIGMALQLAERRLARHWANYERSEPATIRYPDEWTMQGDGARRADAEALALLKDVVPSRTAQKEILKQVARKLIAHKVSPQVMDAVEREVDVAECLTVNISDLEKEVQLRIVSAETASRNRGYPVGEHKKALDEQAAQLAVIAISQSKGAGAAQGVPAGSATADTTPRDQKVIAGAPEALPQNNTRGAGK